MKNTLFIFLLFICSIWSSCNKEKDKIVKPTIQINNLYGGSKFFYENGRIPIQIDIDATEQIEKVFLVIKAKESKNADWYVEKTYVDGLRGNTQAILDDEIQIPESTKLGKYALILTVFDQQGNSAISENEINIAENEHEGAKLIVTYQDSRSIDLLETHSMRNDILTGSGTHSNVGKELRFYMSNAIVYNQTDIHLITTGLDWHINHFHTDKPKITNTANFSNGSGLYWRGNIAVFQSSEGSIATTNAEGVMNGYSPNVLNRVITPHIAKTVNMGWKYVVSTDLKALDSNKEGDVIRVFDAQNGTIIKEFAGYNIIKSATTARINVDEYALFATDQGILALGTDRKGDITNMMINNPTSFNNEPMDQLINKFSLQAPNFFYGVKNNEGIFKVNFEHGDHSIQKIIALTNIDKVLLNPNNTIWYVLTKDKKLLSFDAVNNHKLSEISLDYADNKEIRIVSSLKFVYLTYPGTKEIIRLSASNLDKHSSILRTNRIHDIGIAGNIDGHPIDNH